MNPRGFTLIEYIVYLGLLGICLETFYTSFDFINQEIHRTETESSLADGYLVMTGARASDPQQPLKGTGVEVRDIVQKSVSISFFVIQESTFTLSAITKDGKTITRQFAYYPTSL